MGYRLSGGMLFKFTMPLMGINDMKMMIRFSLGGEMCTEEERNKLDVTCGNKIGAQLNIPLSVGTISRIEGLEVAKSIPCLQDFIQYYNIGDTITEKVIGTLGQHFGRFTLIADDTNEISDAVETITKSLLIYDANGNLMNDMKFDLNRTNYQNI